MNTTCKNCRYFKASPTGLEGTCHRTSPMRDPEFVFVQWPVLVHNDWCGDWELMLFPDSDPIKQEK